MAADVHDFTDLNYKPGLTFGGNRLTIVWVDDEFDASDETNALMSNVYLLKRLIERDEVLKGIAVDVVIANVPADAIELMRDQNLANTLVITDFNMPVMNGVQMATEMRHIGFKGSIFVRSGLKDDAKAAIENLSGQARELHGDNVPVVFDKGVKLSDALKPIVTSLKKMVIEPNVDARIVSAPAAATPV